MKRFLTRLLLATALLTTPVLAQEAEHKSESGGEKPGMKSGNGRIFAILAGILGYMISKNVGPLLVARSAEIQEGLAAGERAKAEADARAAAVAAKLSGLDQAIAQMKAAATEEREREVARIQREAAAELARIQQNAKMEIEHAGKLARFEIQRAAAKAAIDLAEQKVRARMTPDVQEALLQSFANEVVASAPPDSRRTNFRIYDLHRSRQPLRERPCGCRRVFFRGIDPATALQQLRSFDAAIKASADLRTILASPAVSIARKRLVIRRIAEALHLERIIQNFLLVLTDHRRAAALSEVIESFDILLDERLGFTRAEVVSAFELTQQQRDRLSAELATLAGTAVRMRFSVDPDLIGGVTARLASKVYDGSVRGRLETMRQRLAVN